VEQLICWSYIAGKTVTLRWIEPKFSIPHPTGGEFWSDGYYAATVGEGGNWSVVTKYVCDQGKDPKVEQLRLLWYPGACPGEVHYLNNIVESDHRFIKRTTKPMMGFKAFHSANATLLGIELHHMLRKGQHKNAANMTVFEQFYALAV